MKTIDMKRGPFAEIYGNSEGLWMLLLDKNGKPYNGSTCCKDFFTDAFWAEHHKKPTSIHGFQCAPGRLDLDSATYLIAMHHAKGSLEDKKGALESFLHPFEWAFKVHVPSTVVQVNEGKDLLVSFSRDWTKRPVMISLFTGLLRVGLMYDPEKDKTPMGTFHRLLKEGNPFGKYDKSEFGKEGVVPLLQKCVEDGTPPHPGQTFQQYEHASSAHHSGGFIAFTTGRATA